MTAMADGAQVRLDLQCYAQRDSIYFDADPDRILQVLTNLLSNAIKFTPQGGSIVIIEDSKTPAIKTNDLAKRFGKLGFTSALVVDGEFDKNFALSARNLSHVSLLPASGLNVYDILRRDKLVLTKAAVKAIEERLS